LHQKDSNEEMKHKLDDIDKRVDFKVPEGYFENLPLRIQDRIAEEKSEAKTFRIPSWSYAMAASVLLVVTFVFVVNDAGSSAETLLSEVSEEALIAYLEEIEIDEYDIAAALPDNGSSLQLDDIEMLNDLDLEGGSFDDIMLEYNLEDESFEI